MNKNNNDEILEEYLNQIKKYPLLTKEEEVSYFKKINEAKKAEASLNLILNDAFLKFKENTNRSLDFHSYLIQIVPNCKEENLECLKDYIIKNKIKYDAEKLFSIKFIFDEGTISRDILINSNLRLVVSIAKENQNRGLNLNDLIQEGNFGLLLAIDKFDLNYENRFSTYATYLIKQKIELGISKHAHTIRIPDEIKSNLIKIKKCMDTFYETNERAPSYDEISKITKISSEKIEYYLSLEAMNTVIENNNDEDEENNINPINLVIDESDTPDIYAEKEITDKKYLDNINKLSDKEKYILFSRNGLVNGKRKTLDDLSKELKISKERVRQIQKEAIEKLKN